MTCLYNEIEPYAAGWLRNLIDAGHLPPGRVDETDVRDLDADALPETCHFFAGIGGWPLALRMAGWPEDLPAWTGSCPCQPFSQAGKGRGFDDERHLWPYWRAAIGYRRPAVVFGEQVASPAGRTWLARVRADMEALGYAVGAADLCAAGVGAPHLRQRLWFVALAGGDGREILAQARLHDQGQSGDDAPGRGDPGGMGDAHGAGVQRRPGGVPGAEEEISGAGAPAGGDESLDAGSGLDAWDGATWVVCRDGKARPIEPGILPLAHGVPRRVGKLRAYGNAIVPQVGAIFVRSVMECL